MYAVVFLLEHIKYSYTNVVRLYVGMIYRNKMALEFNYVYGKTWAINV